jgi:hypothetical protein
MSEQTPPDLIPLSEACKRGPRPARGRRRHRSTVLVWWYVSASELDALLRPAPVDVPLGTEARDRLEAAERAAYTDRVLREAGVRR